MVIKTESTERENMREQIRPESTETRKARKLFTLKYIFSVLSGFLISVVYLDTLPALEAKLRMVTDYGLTCDSGVS